MRDIPPVRESALNGIRQGEAKVAEEAQNLSTAFTPDSNQDAVSASIGIKAGVRQVTASAKLLRVADELDKAVLDILA